MALDTESLLLEKARLEKQIKQAQLEIDYNGGLAQLSSINPNGTTAKVLADAKARLDSSTSYLNAINDQLAAVETITVPTGSDSGVTVGPIAASAGPVKATALTESSSSDYVNGSDLQSDSTVKEQKVVDQKQDAQLSQEEQGQLREFQESQRAVLKAESDKAGNPEVNTASSVNAARAGQTIAVTRNTIKNDDWRVRLSLAPNAKYLYNLAAPTEILYPVKLTDGVIFPYTPTIQTAYKANYESMNLTHTNYKMYFYKNSSVDEITLTADFTAQDTTEANYLLGVIHFFKSVTKMFYGQDGNNGPRAGTPPPMCYLNGYGTYQFNEHPVLITSFTYSLPNDVDYIRAGSVTVAPGTNTDSYTKGNAASKKGFDLMSWIRTSASNLKGKQGKGSSPTEPKWTNYSNPEATYVPTKMQIQLSLLPIVTRNDISKNFSLEKYAKGDLLKGRNRPSGGGIW